MKTDKDGVFFPNEPDKWGTGPNITVAVMREFFNALEPEYDDYTVGFDGGCGGIYKNELRVNHDSKTIVLND